MGTEREYKPRISDLAAHDRPRERLAEVGARGLRDAELLAILLRTGRAGENVVRLAERVLAEVGGLTGLHRASFTDLCSVRGIGPAKAAQLVAALELGRRIAIGMPDERTIISSPADAAGLLTYTMSALEQEYLFVLLLDTRNRIIGQPVEVYHGSLNTSLIRTGEIFREAIKVNAAGVIVAHNHPSGDPSPSPEDVAVTRALVEAGKLLDIDVLDHLVIGQGRFVSLKDRGLGFG
ncbi:MAG: DNA repair protein RadC [Acidobacteria bacterium]|nr:DNA repair protein RadC [Acidobacteriota bacterium]